MYYGNMTLINSNILNRTQWYMYSVINVHASYIYIAFF